MEINSLKINGFGKIENKEINLEKNINLIYGKNEAGKTSILKFISGMLYGISKNKNGKEISDFEKYKPWKAKEYSGKIKYTLDNKKQIEVFRDFAKKNPKIYDENMEDISKAFNIDKNKGNLFFYEQTKIDEIIFESTTLIEQKETVLNENNQKTLTQKIANILTTGEDDISYKKTIDKINKKMLEEVGTERTVGRPLNVVLEKIEENKNRIKELENTENEKIEINKKINEIKNGIEENNLKLEILKKIKNNFEENNLENEKIKINNNLLEENKNKVNNLDIEIKKIKNNKNNKFTIIIILLLIINIFSYIFKFNNIIKIILGIILLISFIFGINKINKNKMKTNKLKNEKEAIEKIIKNINEEILKLEEKLLNKKNNFEKIILNNYSNNEEIKQILNENFEMINKKINNELENINKLKLELYSLEISEKNINNKLEDKIKIEEQLKILENQKKEILDLEEAINLAKNTLEIAYNKMKNEVTPKFTKNLSKIASNISNKKYEKINFNDEEGLIVELENGEYVKANRLSIGTIDQLYLSLRLSTIKELTEENMPIILDETFAYYDDERLKNILEYLNNNFKENQIIIFTCSNREKEILNKLEIKYNLVEI